MISYRQLNESDVDAFFDLRAAGLRAHPEAFGEDSENFANTPREQIAKRCTPTPQGSQIIGAFDGDALIGCVGMARNAGIKNEHKAFIWGMIVDRHYRGKGIARQLLQQAIAAAKAHNIRELTLAVVTTNTGAAKLYESLGFIDYGLEPQAIIVNGTPYDERLMRLVLS